MIGDIFLFIVLGILILMNIALVGSTIKVSAAYQSMLTKYNDLAIKYSITDRTIRSLNTDSVDDTVLDALKIAMKQSHPDNGGSSDDFIRFREALRRYSSNR